MHDHHSTAGLQALAAAAHCQGCFGPVTVSAAGITAEQAQADLGRVCCTLPLHALYVYVFVLADKAMQDVFGAEYVSLHVRVSNKGAIHLYTQTLGYE